MTSPTDGLPSPAAAEATNGIEAVIGRLLEASDALVAIVEQETMLVRAGRLRETAQLERAKGDFANSYVKDLMRLSENKTALAAAAPELLETFRQRHAHFHDLLRTNMTVLATAHAVSQDLIRGVSGELARKSAPQTYGASGRPATPGPSAIQPLAVSRML